MIYIHTYIHIHIHTVYIHYLYIDTYIAPCTPICNLHPFIYILLHQYGLYHYFISFSMAKDLFLDRCGETSVHFMRSLCARGLSCIETSRFNLAANAGWQASCSLICTRCCQIRGLHGWVNHVDPCSCLHKRCITSRAYPSLPQSYV